MRARENESACMQKCGPTEQLTTHPLTSPISPARTRFSEEEGAKQRSRKESDAFDF